MNVSLTEELEKFVDKEVRSGLYQSASEVVRAGLRRLREDQERKPCYMVATVDELEGKLAQGVEELESGQGIPGDQVISELKKRSAKLRRGGR